MTRTFAAMALAACVGATASAHADVCDLATFDPIASPVRAAGIDASPGACRRAEVGLALGAHALVDTPGFYGHLGADLTAAARRPIGARLGLGLRYRILDGDFVQNAVNQVTALERGPLLLDATWQLAEAPAAAAALQASLEVPWTRSGGDTTNVGGRVAVASTLALAPRWALHSHLGVLAAQAASSGGTSRRAALLGGLDLAVRAGTRLAVHAGAHVQAGWDGGLGHVLPRLGLHGALGDTWRYQAALALPLGGDERTNLVLTLGAHRPLP